MKIPTCLGHKSGIGNKYKCSSLACDTISTKRLHGYYAKDLMANGALDGIYKTDNGYRSEHLDVKEAA